MDNLTGFIACYAWSAVCALWYSLSLLSFLLIYDDFIRGVDHYWDRKIINCASSETLYSQEKEAILKAHSETGEQKVRRLILELRFDGWLLSDLFRRMQRMINNQVSPAFVQQI